MKNGKYTGKKLLMLGSNVGSVDIVEYAKRNGAYTIVADYYSAEYSMAKKVADEHVLISTGDIEGLSKVIEQYNIDAVLAGISEFNLLNAQKLAEKYNLPFYFNRRQWDLIEKKNEFRNLCEKYAVPCPKTYFIGNHIEEQQWKEIKYPAVIKPVDASTSAGVHICFSENEMRLVEEDSFSKSVSKTIIVEEFVSGGEFTAHYLIANGKATLSCIDNRYPVSVHEGNVTTIPAARIYPCIYIDEYIKQVNPFMISLCESLEMVNGILFVQGMYDENKNQFNIFEAGLRSAGEAPYRFIEKINGINALQVLVDHAFGISTDIKQENENPYMNGKCCGIVSFVARGGKVGKISGLEQAVEDTQSVITYESRYPVGSETPDGDTLRQLMIRFVMICENREQMVRDVGYLNSHITVLNEQGENMVIKIEPEKLYQIP